MTEPAPLQSTPPPVLDGLADGEWHRLHPATPFLRGGIALVAIAGLLFANLRDRFVQLVVGFREEGDPVDVLLERHLLIPALLVALVIVALVVLLYYLSWRFNRFRVTGEVVELRSGVLSRTQRQARLDRIQGVEILRPLLARIFGAARLQISVAGQDANIRLDYLRGADADRLRRDVLTLASGARRSGAPAAATAKTGVVQQRLDEFLAPELDPSEAPPESVVHISPGRMLGSVLLSDFTVAFVLVIIGLVTWAVAAGNWLVLLPVFPTLLGMGSILVRRTTRTLRFTIAGTANGVRVGYGLLSTSSQTLPPGRIHAVSVRQPLLWRTAGWWRVTVNVAGSIRSRDASAGGTTVLPVGTIDDVARVLALVLPALEGEQGRTVLLAGVQGHGGDDGYINAPRRAAWLRPFAWRRTGFALADGVLLLRAGRLWRSLVLVPEARLQSVALIQGPVRRALGLAALQAHTVAGPIVPALDVVDATVGTKLFDDISRLAVDSAESDTTHRWNAAGASE